MLRFRRELAFALTLGLFTSGVATAQTEDADWDLLLPQDRLVDVVPWNGRVVGADALAGLVLYDPETATFTTLTSRDGLTTNRTRSLLVDGDGDLWVGTVDTGILVIDVDGGIRALTSLAEQGEIRALARDGDFVYYASSDGGGAIANEFPEQVFDADQGLPSDDLVDVAAHDGRVWFATSAGVGFFDRAANTIGTLNDGLPGPDVVAIDAGPDGVFAAVGGSVLRLDESVPDAPVWTEVLPAPGLTILDLEVRGGTLAVLGAASRVRLRALDASNWQFLDEDPTAFDWLALHLEDDGTVWTAGRRVDRSLGNDSGAVTLSSPLFWSSESGNSPALDFRYGESARSLEIDGEGGVWIGYVGPPEGVAHWRADGSVRIYPRRDSEQNQGPGDGWLNGLKGSIERSDDGTLWVVSFADVGGLTRFRPDPDGDPAGDEYFHLRVSDDLLKSRRILDLEIDPRGRIWAASDAQFTTNGIRNYGLDVLIDPENLTDPTSWVKIIAANSGLEADEVRALAFDGDVVWLAVGGVGVQRWDLTGSADDLLAAAADPNRWDTLRQVPESNGTTLEAISDVAVGDDGRIWVATDGQGTFSFRYDPVLVGGPDVESFRVEEFGPSLITNGQLSLAVEGGGVVWSAGEGGLHRLRIVDSQPVIDPFTNVAGFLARDLSRRFGTEIVTPLPNERVRTLTYDAARDELYVGTDIGVARVRVRSLDGAVDAVFDAALRPNPLRDGDALRVTDFQGTLDGFVYTLAGRLVHSARGLEDGDLLWDTRNAMNERVSSGMYLVRLVRSDGAEIVRTVAIER